LYKAVHASSRSRDSRVDTDRLTERNRRGNTRARDQLLVCGVEPKSEFLKDFS
jgi:hypothetical protein